MSTSKKKRMGSHRRSLNQNVEETHKNNDPENSPPVPQSRPRAEAKADLTLSPDNAQTDMPVRKKKLGSQRGNKGRQPFKDFTTESSHMPLEEAEDNTTHTPAPLSDEIDILNFKSESPHESLEGNVTSVAQESEVEYNRILTETEAIAPKSKGSPIDASVKDHRFDWILKDGRNEKYLPEVNEAQEGVLKVKNQAKQMPEILEATFPAGVTEETTCTVKSNEKEISITDSHDNNKNTEDEVGHSLEKPVSQENEKRSLPDAHIRKLGSSRRKKERKLEELLDQHEETAVETNVFNVLEKNKCTNEQNSSKDINVDTHIIDSATSVTYKKGGQLDVQSSPKMGIEQIMRDDILSEIGEHKLLEEEVKSNEVPGDLQKELLIGAGGDLFTHTDSANVPVVSLKPDVSISTEDDTAPGSQLIGNRRKQVQFMFEEQSPENAVSSHAFDEKADEQELAESQQVHDDTLETVEDTIPMDICSTMSEQAQTVKSVISKNDSDIFDNNDISTAEMSFYQPDTDSFGRFEEDNTSVSQDSLTKSTEVHFDIRNEISASPEDHAYPITGLPDDEMHEEVDKVLNTTQTHYDQAEETKIYKSDFVNLNQKGDKRYLQQEYHELFQESDETIENIKTDSSAVEVTPSSTVQESDIKAIVSLNENTVDFDFAPDAEHKDDDKDLKEDSLDGSHLLSETLELKAPVEKSLVTEIQITKEKMFTELSDPVFGVLPGIQPSTEEELCLDETTKNLLNFATAQLSEGALNENEVSETEDMHHITSSSESVPCENKESSSVRSIGQEETTDKPHESADGVSTSGDSNKEEDQKENLKVCNDQPVDLQKVIQSHNETTETAEATVTGDKSANTSEITVSFLEEVQEQTVDGNNGKKVDYDIFDEWAGDQPMTTETPHQPPDSNAHQIFFLPDYGDMDSYLKKAHDTEAIEEEAQSNVKQATEQPVHKETAEELHESADGVSASGDSIKDEDQKDEVKLSNDQQVDLQKEKPLEGGKDLSSVQIPQAEAGQEALAQSFIQSHDETTETVEVIVTETQHQPPDNAGRPLEVPTLGQGEERDFTEQGEPKSITHSEKYLTPKQINVHQIFFLSDNEDMDSYLKPAHETKATEEEDLSDGKQSTKQPVDEETVGEPPETVQTLDIEVNKPTDPRHSPIRRKLGSSQRSKGSKQEVTTTNNDGISPVNKDFLQVKPTEAEPDRLDLTTDGQQEIIVPVEDTEDTVSDLSSSPKEKVVLDQKKDDDLAVDKTNLWGPEENLSRETKAENFDNDNQDIFSLISPGKVHQDEKEEEIKLSDGQVESSELSSEQVSLMDNASVSPVSPNPDGTANVEDVTVHPQFIGNRRKLGSSRRTKDRKKVDDYKEKEHLLMEQNTETAADSDIVQGKAFGHEMDQSSIQPVQGVSAQSDDGRITSEKSLNTTETTTLFKEVTQEQNVDTDDHDQSNIRETSKQQPDNTTLETPAENTTKQGSSAEARDAKGQFQVEPEKYLSLKEPLNAHQLTFLSDKETNKEMENWPLQQTEHTGHREIVIEDSETEKLLHNEGNEHDAAPKHSPSRRKLGSSRRIKERKQEEPPIDNEGLFSIENTDFGKVTEVMGLAEEIPQKELQSNNLEQQNNLTPEDTGGAKTQENSRNIEIQVVSHKPFMEVIQKEGTDLEVDSYTIKHLKETDIAGTEDLQLDADIGTDNRRSQNESTNESEEIVRAEPFDASQTVVISPEDIAKKQAVKDAEVVQTGADLQINPEPRRRKMGSTRRSQLNRKQPGDEPRTTDDQACIFEKTTVQDVTQIVIAEDKETKSLPSDIFVNQGEATIAASPVTGDQQSEESNERPEVAQEDKKEEALQTEDVMLVEKAAGTITSNIHSITGEEIQTSSPGVKRKISYTHKNLKRESPEAAQEENGTTKIARNDSFTSVSNENVETKEDSGLLIHTATVHKQSDEETPRSQQNSQGKLSSQSPDKETEMPSKPDAFTEETAGARRRKMGSHRKPHTDQSVRQGRSTNKASAVDESVFQPLAEESAKLGQVSEVNVRDTRTLSAASPLSLNVEPKPLSERSSQRQPLPSTNAHLAQERNFGLSSGFGSKASLNASKYEVVMIGDSCVGKTSFMRRAQSGKFSSDLPASVGLDSYMWTVVVDGKTVVLHLWDTAGQERFRSMTKQIFHRAQAFLLMYDISSSQSFTAVSYWANCIKEGATENVAILLLGNKSDCTHRKVTKDEGEILAQENNFAFMECSAATGENVIEALETVARLLSQKAARAEEPLELRKPEKKNKFGCC